MLALLPLATDVTEIPPHVVSSDPSLPSSNPPYSTVSPSGSVSTIPESHGKPCLASQPPHAQKGSPELRVQRVFSAMCVVCGDPAIGMNYSVATCCGCKTFFRRTVISGRRHLCQRDGQCAFAKQGKWSCRACRFKKCLHEGMDPRGVQRGRYVVGDMPSNSNHHQEYDRPLRFSSNDMDEMLGEALTRSDSSCSPPRFSYDGYSPVPLKSIQSRQENEENNVESPIFSNCRARAEYWLNYELSISFEYAKTHTVFRNLSFCDKCAVLENTDIALFIFTSAYEAFCEDNKALHYANGDDVILADGTGSPTSLIESMKRCSIDLVTFALSKTIILLNSDAAGLTPEGRKQLGQERDRYVRLLTSYTLERFRGRGASILADSILLPVNALALGRRVRGRPPADAILLHITTPLLPVGTNVLVVTPSA